MITGLTIDEQALYAALAKGDSSLLKATTTLNIQPTSFVPGAPASDLSRIVVDLLQLDRHNMFIEPKITHITHLKVHALIIANGIFTNKHLEKFTRLTSFQVTNAEDVLRTPLWLCSQFGLDKGVKLLIESGANVDEHNETIFPAVRERGGNTPLLSFTGTPLMVARTTKTISSLIEAGAAYTEEVENSLRNYGIKYGNLVWVAKLCAEHYQKNLKNQQN